MGNWINLKLIPDKPPMNVYEMYSTEQTYECSDGGERYRYFVTDFTNLLLDPTKNGGVFDKVGNQSNADNVRSVINTFVNRMQDISDVMQLSSRLPNGGSITYNDGDGNPEVTVVYNRAKIMYRTIIMSGYSAIQDYGSWTGYQEYHDLADFNRGHLGIKMRVMVFAPDSQVFSSNPDAYNNLNSNYECSHLIAIDDMTVMSEDDTVHANIGFRISDYCAVTTSFTHYNHHFLVLFHDTQTGKVYLRKAIGYAENRRSPQLHEYMYFGFDNNFNYDFTDVVLQEEDDMDDLMNRFSPRGNAGSVGLYKIPASGANNIQWFMKDLMYTDITDTLNKAFFGDDQKQYIMGLRWYYGLNKAEGKWELLNGKRGVRIGKTHLNKWDNIGSFRTTDEFKYEWATFTTSELSVMPHFDNYLDMLSTYQLYLPYYGFLNIDPNDILGGTIQVVYRINLATGAACVHVICKTARTGNAKIKCYDVNCQVGEDIPYGINMMQDTLNMFGQVLISGVKAGMKGASLGSTINNAKLTGANQDLTALKNSGNYDEGGAKQIDAALNHNNQLIHKNQTISNVVNEMPTPEPIAPVRSSYSGAEAGCLDDLYPYLLITRPIRAGINEASYGDYVGLPSYAAANLSAVNGFTQIICVKPGALTNPPKYVNEIISLLQAGVYL